MKANEIRAVELVRQIRDAQAEQLKGKTPAEVIEFFRRAGIAALEEARQRTAAMAPPQRTGY